VTPRPGTHILAYAGVPYFNRTWRHFCSHQYAPMERITGGPVVTQRDGVIYIARPLFREYARSSQRVHRQVLANCLRRLLPRPRIGEHNLPSTAVVTVRRQGCDLIVHLLHYVPQRRGELDIVEDVLPLVDVELSVRTERRPSAVQLVPQEEPMAWELRDGYARLQVPRVWGHQLAGITYLTCKYKEAHIVGLCHGFRSVYHLVEVLGLEREHITFEIPGVNHFVWLTHFHYKGRDAFPLVDEWIEKEAPEYWETCRLSSGLGPKAVDLYKQFGAFPIGDTCTPGGGAWPWWYHTDDETEERWREDPQGWWEAGYFPHLEKRVEQIHKVARDTSIRATEAFPPRKSGEFMVPLVESIACDIPRVMITNIPNTGDFVPGLPRDFEVEVPALVSRRGVQGIRTNGLPDPLLAYTLRDRVAPVEVELEAYEKGSRELLLQLLLMDPWTQSEEQAGGFLEDILALPYHEDMRRHYR